MNAIPVVIGLQIDATNVHWGFSNDGGNSFTDYYTATCSTYFTNCAAITKLFYGGQNTAATAGGPAILIGVK
jgi:hypothetical protein